MNVKHLSEVSCEVPDCIHSLVLSDELNELLNSEAELKTALSKNQTNVCLVRSLFHFSTNGTG